MSASVGSVAGFTTLTPSYCSFVSSRRGRTSTVAVKMNDLPGSSCSTSTSGSPIGARSSSLTASRKYVGHALVHELLEHDLTSDLGVDDRLRGLAGSESGDLDLARDRPVGEIQILVDLLGGNFDRQLDGVCVGALNGGLHGGAQATRDHRARTRNAQARRAGRLPPMYEDELAFAQTLADAGGDDRDGPVRRRGPRDPAQGRSHPGDRGRHGHRTDGPRQRGDGRSPATASWARKRAARSTAPAACGSSTRSTAPPTTPARSRCGRR